MTRTLAPSLFDGDGALDGDTVPSSRQRQLGQYPTPCWVAEALIERHFADLDADDVVLEPTCGAGRFLQAIPAHVPAFGVELDDAVAAEARRATGRSIITADIRTVTLSVTPTHVIGNPPFEMSLVDALLDRAYAWLPEGGRAGLILPTYAFQSATRVARYARRWSLTQEMIPKSIYPKLETPLCFAVFSRWRRRVLVGFALYQHAAAIQGLNRRYRRLLESGGGSIWRRVVVEALASLGGEAELAVLYAEISGRRPTENQHWKEKVRQTLQLHCRRVRKGRWALARAAASLEAEAV